MAAPSCIAFCSEKVHDIKKAFRPLKFLVEYYAPFVALGILLLFWWSITLLLLPLGFLYFFGRVPRSFWCPWAFYAFFVFFFLWDV
jgi:hypothetical protein